MVCIKVFSDVCFCGETRKRTVWLLSFSPVYGIKWENQLIILCWWSKKSKKFDRLHICAPIIVFPQRRVQGQGIPLGVRQPNHTQPLWELDTKF